MYELLAVLRADRYNYKRAKATSRGFLDRSFPSAAAVASWVNRLKNGIRLVPVTDYLKRNATQEKQKPNCYVKQINNQNVKCFIGDRSIGNKATKALLKRMN